MSVEKTLEVRGSKYGTMENNANVTQLLMRVLKTGTSYESLDDMHLEVLHMIMHKISRMVNGDPDYVDNPHDIAGYAVLLENYLIQKEKECIDAPR
jgi:hypothetical protein